MINPLEMISSVAILCLMVLPGYFLSKFKLADGKFAVGLSNFILYIAQCCLFVYSFANTKFSIGLLWNMLIIFFASILTHLLFTGVAYLFYRRTEDALARVLRFATVFTNAGYMSLALFELLAPGNTEIKLYASVYLIFFNMYMWSIGIMLYTKDRSYIRVRHMFLNPAVIATAIGLILFFCQSYKWINCNPVTETLNSALNMLGQTVGPLSMVVVGVRLGMTSFKGYLKDKQMWLYMFVRLLLSPVLVFCITKPIFLLLELWIGEASADALMMVVLVCASAPAATSASMFAERYDADAGYAGKLVSVSTILSALSMPLCALLLLI